MHLANGSLAAGPQFGRLVSLAGEPLAECTPRLNSVRARLQKLVRKREEADGARTSEADAT